MATARWRFTPGLLEVWGSWLAEGVMLERGTTEGKIGIFCSLLIGLPFNQITSEGSLNNQ